MMIVKKAMMVGFGTYFKYFYYQFFTCEDDGKNSKVFDTYSFMEFGETAQKKHEEPVIKEDFVIREEDEPVNVNDKVVKDSPVEELGDIPPPFLL